MHIRDDFSGGSPISQVPASWFNSVAKFINSLIGGDGVTLNKHDDGTESVISVDNSGSMSDVPPEDIGSNASAGTSEDISRADHVHALPTDDSLAFDNDGNLCVKVENDGGLTSGSDGLYVSAVGDGNKWMKTDGNGYAATTDETPIIADSSSSGVVYNTNGTVSYITPATTQAVDCVTGVSWNGTTLSFTKKSLTFTNGVLTSVGTETTTTIDTPVVYTGT